MCFVELICSLSYSHLLYFSLFAPKTSFVFSFPVIQLYVSSYRAITYYQLFEHTKHKMLGMSPPHKSQKYIHIYIYKNMLCLFFLSLPPLDHLEATGCTVKVRPLDSRPSLPSSRHQTTWMFTTTKVRNCLCSFFTNLSSIHLQFCHLFLLTLVSLCYKSKQQSLVLSSSLLPFK